MINKRHHDRRQLANMIWYDLDERRQGDERRAAQAERALRGIKLRAFFTRWGFHLTVIGTIVSYTIFCTTCVAK